MHNPSATTVNYYHMLLQYDMYRVAVLDVDVSSAAPLPLCMHDCETVDTLWLNPIFLLRIYFCNLHPDISLTQVDHSTLVM